MSIADFLHDQTVIMVLQLVIGRLWKSNPQLENKFIPWVSLGLSFIGYNLMPATANAASSLSGLAPYASAAVLAALQTALVTGVHSFSKNALSPLWENALKAIAFKIIQRGETK